MPRLRFRAPGRSLTARQLLARLLPGRRPATLGPLLRSGALHRARVQARRWEPGAAVRSESERIEPGCALWLELPSWQPPQIPRVRELHVLLPVLPWREGRVPPDQGGFCFVAEELRGRLVRLRIEREEACGRGFLDWLAGAGWPVLGDLQGGGIAVREGLCLAQSAEALRWPREAVFPADASRDPASPALRVSAASAAALRRGHPWVLEDRGTGDAGRWAPGGMVRLEDPAGRSLGLARLDPGERPVARVWSPAGGFAESLEERVGRSLRRRAALWAHAADPGGCDAFRLIHGEADGLPGLFADRLGEVLRVGALAPSSAVLLPRLVAALRRELAGSPSGPHPVVEVLCMAHAPPGTLQCVRLSPGSPPIPSELWVHEAGLRFRVDPGLGAPHRPRVATGLFLDQRENRARIRARVQPGGRYLNLFAHTGAFTLQLLAGGAGEVASVDLSGAYLAILEENLRANGLADRRHRAVRRDARRFLAQCPEGERYDGIVLDPPTAAAAGRSFWSVEQHLEELLVAALGRLVPGGWLLLCRNDRQPAGSLEPWTRRVAARHGLSLAGIEAAPPGEDFPALLHFPEGDAFRAVLVRRGEEH